MAIDSLSISLVTDDEKVTKSVTRITDKVNEILNFCSTLRILTDILEHIGMKRRNIMKQRYINPLVKNGFLEPTIPDGPNSRN